MRKLHSLTVLRAIAATSVIFFHVMMPTGHAFGKFGVDIFFVLSGFVIALVMDNPDMTARRFFADRVARIVPLYWLLTFAVFAGTLIVPALFNSTTADVGDLLKSLFFIPYRKGSGHIFPMLFVGWTLNYEMMFYLVSALSLMLLRRHRLLFVTGVILAIFVVAKASGSHGAIAEFYSYDRMLEFPLGFVAYLMWRQRIRISPVVAAAVVAAAFVSMAVVEWNGWGGAPLLCFGIPAFLMVACGLSLESAVGANLPTRTAILVGNASYATYLSHPYCVEAARKLLPKIVPGFDVTTPVGVVLVIVAATATGCVLYGFADRPLHRNARLLMRAAPAMWLRRFGLAQPEHDGAIVAGPGTAERH